MKFGIIGFGNLGRAVASALVGTGDVASRDVHVCDSSTDALSLAGEEHFNVYPVNDINRMISSVDVICLVVKGYIFEDLAKSIDPAIIKDKLVISFMAGVSIEKISSLIKVKELTSDPLSSRTGEGLVFTSAAVARAMPSLAIASNEGVVAYTKLPDEVSSIFAKFGYAFEVSPEEIEKVTAFASCGLGFAAYLIDAFKAAGESLGFSAEQAAFIAAQTFKNASDKGLAVLGGVDGNTHNTKVFSDIVNAVATRGGATEQGVKHMSECDVFGIVADAMKKAHSHLS